MVNASKPAARKLADSASIITERPDSATPILSASPGWTLPAGMGRLAVRFMMWSMSASHHMFSAPEAPAPMAINRIDAKPTTGFTPTGAANMPTNAVNTTSCITRGFISAK